MRPILDKYDTELQYKDIESIWYGEKAAMNGNQSNVERLSPLLQRVLTAFAVIGMDRYWSSFASFAASSRGGVIASGDIP